MTNFALIKDCQNSNIPDLATYFRMTANVAKSRFDCTSIPNAFYVPLRPYDAGTYNSEKKKQINAY